MIEMKIILGFSTITPQTILQRHIADDYVYKHFFTFVTALILPRRILFNGVNEYIAFLHISCL
jgi:hypothetical protein